MLNSTILSCPREAQTSADRSEESCEVVVIWIDWYAYHVGRFQGILGIPSLSHRTHGIELVGGAGVHAGLTFREHLPDNLPVETLMPGCGWHEVSKLRLSIALWRRLTHIGPKVVLVPGYYTLPGVAAALWAKMHLAKSVLMTESTSFDHKRVWWKELIKGLVIRMLFDWAITGGKAHVRYLEQLGFNQRRVSHFYDVVNNSFYKNEASRLRLIESGAFDPPKKYFLYVGRFAAEKNITTLLASWIAYRNAGGDWPLVLVGDGPLLGALRGQAASSAHANEIYFEGHKGSGELPPYYAFAGCFVLPSTREPWGLVVNEAMASALPVLVSKKCGCAEDFVAEGINGFSFNPSDSDELTKLLTFMAALAEPARLQMGVRSMQIVDRYSPQSFGAEVARIVES